MASIKNLQDETVALIDTAKAMVDKVVSIMELLVVSPAMCRTFDSNSIGFSIQILKELGVTNDELKLWITNFLTGITPIMEIAVKAILLTNLKNMISCSVDPRIPEKYRKRHVAFDNDWQSAQEYGIDINIESIDFLDKLSVNPLSSLGSEMYFGLEGIEDVYKFARAEDFDAFLWFVIHKGRFPNASRIDDISAFTNTNTVHGTSATTVAPSDGSLLGVLDVVFDKESPSSIVLGNTFTYNATSNHVVSMCFDKKYDEEDNIVHNTILPVSDDWTSVNWYANRLTSLTRNLGIGWTMDDKFNISTTYKGNGRDFNKERAICNLQYIDQASSDAPLTGLVNNKFRFTILPKPYIHTPILENGEAPWRFKKMLFNSKGEYDSNGIYTFACAIRERVNGYGELEFSGNGFTVKMNLKTEAVTVDKPKELVKNLKECYPGLTVFEFNYDYVMSMRLFDAKTLATALLNSVVDTSVGINISLKKREISDTVKEILKNIINSEDSELSDCYYTFDNSKYDSLLRKAQERRARQERFGNTTHEVGSFDNVREILEEYDTKTDLKERKDILTRAITQASVNVSDGVDIKDKHRIELSFVTDLIENLVTAIVNSILSPKVLMLLEVNKTLMGGTWEPISMSDLLRSMKQIIVAIIKEVRDLVLQELLKFIISKLEPIIQMLGSLILREQLDNYSRTIEDIIRNCPFIWFKFGNKLEEAKIDTVDYADIDTSTTEANLQPSTNNC